MLRSENRWRAAVPDVASPPAFELPAVTLQPAQTPEAERRRQQVMQSATIQQHALMERLQQMERRRLQEEMTRLQEQLQITEELMRQETLLWAETAVEEALRQHYLPQANSEIQRQALRRLWRLRPDLRDHLRPRLQQVEAQQEQLAETLQQRLASIEEETTRRLRERQRDLQDDWERQREELRQRSAQRLRTEQAQAGVMVRPFAGDGAPVTLPSVSQQVAAPSKRPARSSRLPSIAPSPSIRSWIEQDVKRWVEAICRKHRWVPVWHRQAGLPDVTARIAQEMQGTAL